MKVSLLTIVVYAVALFGVVDEPMMDQQWYLDSIYMERAWEYSTGSSEVTVAIVDAGFDGTHRELQPNLWRNELEINGTEGIDDDGNGYIDDECGWDFYQDIPIKLNDTLWSLTDPIDTAVYHGTMSAGIIGAAHDGEGIAGINSSVKLMNIRVFSKDNKGTTDSLFAAAVQYAVDNGADIVNMSLNQMYLGAEGIVGLKPVIDNAPEVLFVTASGNALYNMGAWYSDYNNDPVYLSFPAAYDSENLIAVMMSGAKDVSSFPEKYVLMCSDSNSWLCGIYDPERVDLAAPGGSIYTTSVNNNYTSLSGTSFATPIVSGVAALIKSLDTTASAVTIKEIILSTVQRPLEELDSMCLTGGIIDAGAALEMAAEQFGITSVESEKVNLKSSLLLSQSEKGIHISGLQQKGSLVLRSLNGKVLFSSDLKAGKSFVSLPNLASGVYIAAVTEVGMPTLSQKIFVQ